MMNISSAPHAADAERRMIFDPAVSLGFTAWTFCFAAPSGRLGLSFKEIRRAHDAAFVPPRLEMGEAIGAPVSAMEVMTSKLERDLRGSVNRRVNCDAANLDKAVDAAQGQIEAIYRLEERGMLEELPDKLKEAVDLRVAHPELTLAQLAELCEPPVSKSAFNHRLRKLMEMARA